MLIYILIKKHITLIIHYLKVVIQIHIYLQFLVKKYDYSNNAEKLVRETRRFITEMNIILEDEELSEVSDSISS